MPVMHPAELWIKSGRLGADGRRAVSGSRTARGADFVLGMTHEEIISTLATELESYREAAADVVPVPDQDCATRPRPQGPA